jgi:transposase
MSLVLSVPLGLGTPGPWPAELLADRGYDSDPHRSALRRLGIEARIGRRGTAHGSGLGRYRYVVEQTIAAVHHNRRLKIRYEKRPEIHQAFLTIACVKVCWYRLNAKRN